MTDTDIGINDIHEARDYLHREVVLAARQWFRDGHPRQLRIAVEALERYEKEYLEELG